MQSATIMEMLTTPTTFPLKIDWEGKMEPSSPSDYSQQGFAEEESIFDADTYDFCNEGLFNNALIDLEDLKPDPSELLKRDVVVLPVVKLSEDLCYDDKLKISTGESVLLGNYGPLPTVVEDEFYSFALQPDAKPANHINGGAITAAAAATETLMEFDCGNNLELVNHLTPPQTPPQTTAFGGVVGCVLPMQSTAAPLLSLPMSQQQQQQQQQFQQLYAPVLDSQQPQQLSFSEGNSSEYYIVDEYATMTQIGAGGVQQLQQQETVPLVEPLQQVPGFSFSTEGYTPQQMYEMENIVRSLQQQMEEDASSSSQSSCHGDDDDSCGFSEAGSLESSMVAHSPVYSDSAESSAYYGGSGSNRCNDADDEDWSPSKSKKLNQRNGGMVVKKQQQQQQRTGGSGTTRPYGGRGTEEKKSRKKEQNKNAATRYRQKKKAEIEEILIEESKLRERNEELKIRSYDLGREISCIKKLMREFCKSKGLI